jgi:molecular chaperone Hsp33
VNNESKQALTHDRIMRGLIEGGRARIVVVNATATIQEITHRHGLVGLSAVALGRGVLAGLLLATLTKDDEQVTLQLVANGPLSGVTVDARSSGRVRGFVKKPSEVVWTATLDGMTRLSLGEVLGRTGRVSVIRDIGLSQNYRGECAIQSGEIDEDVEHYLNTSEQIDSVLHCEVLVDVTGKVLVGAGLLIQTLPQARGVAMVEFLRDSLRGPAMAEVLRTLYLAKQVGCEAIARCALLQCAEGMQVMEERPVTFFCPCTRDRALSTLSLLRPDDLQALLLETNEADVECDFCGTHYRFSEEDIAQIRRAHGPTRPVS